MVILAIGDIVGVAGCDYLQKTLPKLKNKYKPDLVIANGENSAQGNGILPASADQIFGSGVDVITTGNHVLRRREIYDVLDKGEGIVRPANYHSTSPGVGYYIFDNCRFKVGVVNLQGNVYMQTFENAFSCIDRILPKLREITPIIVVDFHAEATSEKMCMGYYLDSKVSAVVGTHTHIPTADARVLPKGTGYITDLGMCGAMESVLGVKVEKAVERMVTNKPVRFENENDNIKLSGVVMEIDQNTGNCKSIEQFVFF